MSDQVASRFTPQNKTTHERLSTTTVGLVGLSEFRKRRAEVVEQQEREAREAAFAGPHLSRTSTPAQLGSDSASESGGGPTKKKTKKKHRLGQKLLSFGNDDGDDDSQVERAPRAHREGNHQNNTDDGDDAGLETEPNFTPPKPSKFKANAAVGVVPRPLTKAALRKEATEREALRREYLALQEAIKATEIAIPFVFYDGAHIPGGTVRLKKGDFVWVFLDRCRKVGVVRKNGQPGHPRRGWARAGVDDLMLVRDNVIIPHVSCRVPALAGYANLAQHYDFYYFVMNKNLGPGGCPLFDFSTEASARADAPPGVDNGSSVTDGLATEASRTATASLFPDISTLEGASDDPKMTKVVDRRWYAKNKHIYPASTWQEFDPERDFANEIRKDTGGNTFFFST